MIFALGGPPGKETRTDASVHRQVLRQKRSCSSWPETQLRGEVGLFVNSCVIKFSFIHLNLSHLQMQAIMFRVNGHGTHILSEWLRWRKRMMSNLSIVDITILLTKVV